MLGFCLMLMIVDVSPHTPSVDRFASLGCLGHWVALMSLVMAVCISKRLGTLPWVWEVLLLTDL
jgi:hypothetical protein